MNVDSEKANGKKWASIYKSATVQLFLRHGCCPFEVDKNGLMPVEVAMANQRTLNLVFDQIPTASNPFKWQNCDDEPWSFLRTKNYSVIGDLLRAMATKEGTVKPGLLNTFAQNLSFYQVLRESTMLKEIHHLLITKMGKGLDRYSDKEKENIFLSRLYAHCSYK